MPAITVRGVNFQYTAAGSGEPVVFLHAGGSSSAQWRRVGELLEDRYHLLAVDHYGAGGTDRWGGDAPLEHEDEAELIRALMETLGGPAHLVGHSYGGGIAMRLAVEHPAGLRSLTLIEPMTMPLLPLAGEESLFAEYCGVRDRFLDAVERGLPAEAWAGFIDYRNGEGAWESLSDKARARFVGLTHLGQSAFHANSNHRTTLDECRALALPTLVLCGERAKEPDRRVTEILAETIPGAAFEIIPGAEHMSPLTHPAEVSEAIARHLVGASAAAGADGTK